MMKNNIEIIKQIYPEIYEEIRNYDKEKEDICMKSVISIDGNKNLLLRKNNKEIYLHSSYFTSNEAKRWIKGIDNNEELVIIVGGGYYYHIDELLKKQPNKKILILEPSKSIFMSALKTKDMTQYLEHDNILFVLSDDTGSIAYLIAHIMMNNGIQKFDIVGLISYKELFSDFYEAVTKSILEILKTLRCNLATEYVHSQKWMYNNFRNLRKTNIDTMPLNSFFEKYKDMPALIVSAGPSLEKQLKVLRESENKFIIIAAGSAVNILEKNNIIPHMVIAVDGEAAQDERFKNIKSDKISLIYGHTFRYSSLETFKGNRLWIKGNADSAVDYFEEEIGLNTKAIELGPSCANIAMDVARKLGCNPIVFVGQDLAYTNKQLYAKGSVADHANVTTSAGDRIVMKDMYGNETITKSAFVVMKIYFENYIKEHIEVKYINCTEGGLNIEGMENLYFNDVIKTVKDIDIDIFEDIDSKYKDVYTKLREDNFQEKTIDFIEKIKNESKELKKKSKERIDRINKLLSKLEELHISEIKLEVEEINNITDEIESNTMNNKIMHQIIAAYNLAVRQNTYRKLEKITGLKEKYGLLLEGLKKQYLYYEVILQSLMSALNNE